MAPNFFSKLVKGAAQAPSASTDDGTDPTIATIATKATKRQSRDRSGSTKSTKSGKSRQPSDDTTASYSPRASFQFGISSLNSKNRATSTPSVPKNDTSNNNHSNSQTGLPRKIESVNQAQVPPVPPLPESVKVGEAASVAKAARKSPVVVAGGNKGNSIVRRQLASTDTSAPNPTHDNGSTFADDDFIPVVSVIAGASTDSVNTTSTRLGVTIVPPSPLVYSASLTDSQSEFDVQVEPAEPEQPSEPREDESKSSEQPLIPLPAPPAVTNSTSTESAGSVFGTFFNRRPRTASISSAISGFIGGRPEIVATVHPAGDSPFDERSTTTLVTTPTTAATIKANPFNFVIQDSADIPPVRDIPQSIVSDTMRSNGSSNNLAVNPEVNRKASSRSLTNLPPPLILTHPNFPTDIPPSGTKFANHTRAATSPPEAFHDEPLLTGLVTKSPIVESPTAISHPGLPHPPASSKDPKSAANNAASGSFANLLSPRKADDDAASIISTSSKLSPEKKRPWKRSTTRKPTGLAGAIAASGMALANPGVSPVYEPGPQVSNTASNNSQASTGKQKNGSTPYIRRGPARSTVSTAGAKSSTGLASPKSSKSTGQVRKASGGGGGGRSPSASRNTLHSPGPRRHHRRPSQSGISDGGSSYGNLSTAGFSEYYSGNESEGALSRASGRSRRGSGHRIVSGSESDTESDTDSDSESDSSGDDILDGLDLEDDGMPVTGFAVASNKRNADFHELFRSVPEADYLIEDYGCALQREILIQGRLYISENHVCFHANIFGWITDLSIPISEIISLEKKMTAFVIPNAIQITTRQAKYSFASFLSRDTTFDVIYNIWRVSRPDDIQSIHSGHGLLEGVSESFINGVTEVGGALVTAMNGVAVPPNGAQAKQIVRQATQCACGREGRHYSETAMEAVFPGSPEKIHNLIFASGFIKDFLVTDQKLIDLQMADWMPKEPGSKLLSRTMSYIKPLNGSMGPKQTKCELKDENDHIDYDQYISTITTTRTPDVPSGGVFTIKTRTCITWAGPLSSKVLVTTQVEWTGRSFIKGIIERSAIDGQKVFQSDLERGMRNYIQEHKSEFVPEGVDTSVLDVPPPEAEKPVGLVAAEAVLEQGISDEDRNKQREHERNQRAFQWAWDTIEGALDVAKRSTKDALDLVGDAWDQSSSTTILYFVIVILVISNLWTLVRMGTKEDIGRRKEMMKAEERERWVQSVVMTLWEELASGKRDPLALGGVVKDPGPARLQPERPRVEQLPADDPVSVPTTPIGTPPSDVEPTLLPIGSAGWKVEITQLQEMLAEVEERVRTLKASLAELENLDKLD